MTGRGEFWSQRDLIMDLNDLFTVCRTQGEISSHPSLRLLTYKKGNHIYQLGILVMETSNQIIWAKPPVNSLWSIKKLKKGSFLLLSPLPVLT